MRVLVVHPGPHFSVADVHRGLVSGLRANGVEVVASRFDEWVEFAGQAGVERDGKWLLAFDERAAKAVAGEFLQAEIYRVWPDVIVLVSAFWIDPIVYGVLRRRPHKVVAWYTESPYEDDVQLHSARYVDAVFVNDPTNLDAFRAVNPNSYYAPQSYDPAIHCPGPGKAEWACDVAWVGTAFQERLDWFRAVDWSGIDLRLGGYWGGGEDFYDWLVHDDGDCLDNTDAVTLYRSAKASLNIYRTSTTPGGTAAGWSMGPREVELAATGTFFLRDPRPEGNLVLPMLPTFSDPGDFGDKLRWWLRHDDARRKVADAARVAVADRTFTHAAARLLRTCESIPKAA